MVDEELRLCFNIDVTEDEFYQNILGTDENGSPKPDPVNIFFGSDRSSRRGNVVCACVRPAHFSKEHSAWFKRISAAF